MAAIIGWMKRRRAKSARSRYVVLATLNLSPPLVFSGERKKMFVKRRTRKAKGANRVAALCGWGAYHSPLMTHRESKLQAKLGQSEFGFASAIPVISNVTAAGCTTPAEISANL